MGLPRERGAALVPVQYVKDGPPRSRKVRVRYEDGEFAGLEVWVPRQRLVCAWEEADAFEADEERLAAVRAASRDAIDTTEHRAAWHALYAYPRPDGILLGLQASEGTVVEISEHPLETVAQELGLDAEDLLRESLAFRDRHGAFWAAWPAAVRLAQRVAQVYAREVLAHVAAKETELRRQAVTGEKIRFRGRRGGHPTDARGYDVPAEFYVQRLHREQPAFDLVRQWCGAAAGSSFEEVTALREEIDRLHVLLERAIRRIEDFGHPQVARHLRTELGSSVHARQGHRTRP
jgi:hypothetical protein